MVISAVPKTQLTLSLSSSNLLISGHSAKAYSHSALDRLSRYRVRNKLTFKNSFHYFLYLNLRVGWWAIQILSIPNYSILRLPLASLNRNSQWACLALLIRLMSQTLIFGTRYRYLNRIQIPLCTTLFLGSHFETRTCLNSSLSNAPYFETRTCLKYSPSNSPYIRLYSWGPILRRVRVSNISPFLITPPLVLPFALTTEYINPAGLRT